MKDGLIVFYQNFMSRIKMMLVVDDRALWGHQSQAGL